MNGLSGERAGPLSADDEVPQPARADGVPGTPRRERFCARFRAALMPFLLVVCTGALGAGEEAPDTPLRELLAEASRNNPDMQVAQRELEPGALQLHLRVEHAGALQGTIHAARPDFAGTRRAGRGPATTGCPVADGPPGVAPMRGLAVDTALRARSFRTSLGSARTASIGPAQAARSRHRAPRRIAQLPSLGFQRRRTRREFNRPARPAAPDQCGSPLEQSGSEHPCRAIVSLSRSWFDPDLWLCSIRPGLAS